MSSMRRPESGSWASLVCWFVIGLDVTRVVSWSSMALKSTCWQSFQKKGGNMGRRGESAKYLAYFEEYATMGPERSLEKLAKLLYARQGKPQPAELSILSMLKRASRDYGWVDRVIEYDRQVIRARRRKREEAIERMNEEHALLGRTHALRAAKLIGESIEKDRMTPGNAISLLRISTDLERVARGAETEITRTIDEGPKKHTIAFDLSRLTDEQLEKLEQIAGEVEGDPGEE